MRRIQIWFLFLLVLIGNTSLSGSTAQSLEEVPTIVLAGQQRLSIVAVRVGDEDVRFDRGKTGESALKSEAMP